MSNDDTMQLVITLDAQGDVEINLVGTTKNKISVLGLLELAKHIVLTEDS